MSLIYCFCYITHEHIACHPWLLGLKCVKYILNSFTRTTTFHREDSSYSQEIWCLSHRFLCLFVYWSRLHVPFDLIIRSFIILLSSWIARNSSYCFSPSHPYYVWRRNPLRFYSECHIENIRFSCDYLSINTFCFIGRA